MTHKVVQLTDMHLFETPAGTQKGVNTHSTLQAVVADIGANHPDFDALLLTGDLSQDETPGSYELLKQVLAPLRTAPIYAIPGNHDDLARMRRCLDADDFFIERDARLGRWRIAMLNSQVPGHVHGELGEAQIDRLGRSLGAGDNQAIVVLHHPPVSIHSAWIDASRCLDGDRLLAVLSDPPVKAVVCGHVHQAFDATVEGVRVLTTPSTCVQFAPGANEFATDVAAPGYRVFELEDDGGWSSRICRLGA